MILTEQQASDFQDAIMELIAEGYMNMGDRWLMKEACKRAEIAWERVEVEAEGVSLRLH